MKSAKKITIVIASLMILMAWFSVSCVSSGNVSKGSEWQRVSPDSTLPLTSALSQTAENRKAEILKAFAQGLRDDAYKLQLKGNFDEAIIKYRKSLAYWPDPELEKYIQQIEKKAGHTHSLTGKQPENTLSQVSISDTVTATIRNRSKGSIYIFAQNKTFSSDNIFRPGEIRSVPVQMSANGAITFYAGSDGKVIASETWHGKPRDPNRIPCVLFDDLSADKKLSVMTGLR
jgi:hypothetical protein